MQGRPSSSRPVTSARPSVPFERDQFQHHQQRLQQQPTYQIQEEDEESDDDVFAYLPPTTADQERQTASHSPFAFVNDVQCPSTVDPWGRQYPISPPIPAAENSFSIDPYSYTSSLPPYAAPVPPGIHSISHSQPYPYNQLPLSANPSTDPHPSTGISGPELYRLTGLGTGPFSHLGVVGETVKEQDGDDTKNEDEKKDSSHGHAEIDEDGYDTVTVISEEDGKIPSVHRPQDFQYPYNADTERDAGLEKQSLGAPRGITGAVSVLRERGTKNLNALSYKLYSQQASSYYGRDVRTGTGTASQYSKPTTGYSSSFQHGGGFSDTNSQTQSYHQYQQHRVGMGMAQAANSLPDSLSMMSQSMEDDEGRSIKIEFDFDAIDEEDSPYPEVRASVSNIDDPEMPALTIRMWIVGLFLCLTSSALNVFFNFRNPAPNVVPLVLLLISYPIGKFLAYTLPITTYRIPLPYLPRSIFPLNQPPSFTPFKLVVNLLLRLTYPRVIEFSLNPGPWNIKEHVLVYIMANVAVGAPYALNAIVVSELFYGIVLDYWFSLTLVLATQLTGFGLAGLGRRFLVWPARMIWPQNLVACTLLNTLHAEDEDDGIGMYGGGSGTKGMTRLRFFLIATTASFFFFFLPGYLFQALSVFSYICWAAPTNVPVNTLFGVHSGMGMGVLTFDWSQISWIGSPLMVPWWAEVHIFFGFVVFYWILTPVLYYTNSWDLAYFPISANEPFDRFGNVYNVSRVLLPDDRFDEAAYYAYSPLYLPGTYAMTYLLAFALCTCVIVHTALYHGQNLINGLKKIRVEPDDIHAKLMRNYPEVPEWWYVTAFCAFFGMAVIAVEIWHTAVPVWALLLAVLLPIIYILPSGFIYAMTGQGIPVNILAQIIPGTLLPGNPLANMIFKAYSVQTLAAGISFVQDLKLGHYVKVPPRATFIVQMVATILAAFVQVGVKQWIFKHVPDICQPNQVSQLTCPHNQVFFTASAVWGLIGPTRQFGTGSIYHPHLYAIIAGVFIPIPFYIWQRYYPNSWVRYVNTPVVLAGLSAIPPATGINYSAWFLVAFIFQYMIRKRNFAWWSKFNYVLSSAMDSGTVISIMVIFFALQFPNGGIEVNWWGNRVFESTADWKRTPLLTVPPGGIPWK